MVIGSPEWFYEQAQSINRIKFQEYIENLRVSFYKRFSPERLQSMGGHMLLDEVFGNNDYSMTRLLMLDSQYRNFGAGGKYTYLGIVYQPIGKSWMFKTGKNSASITEDTAAEKAELIRDKLLSCIHMIEEADLTSIKGYTDLDRELSAVFFSHYPWVMKYYQMLFPFYFSGMYSKDKINRALAILGLPNHGDNNTLINTGELSLFIRKCDINNIIFNDIFGSQWGWDGPSHRCEAAASNSQLRQSTVGKFNTEHYKLTGNSDSNVGKNVDLAEHLDQELDNYQVEGADREALVRVRVNQGEFRDKLIKRYGKCCLCGVSDSRLLVASHIKPWVVSEPNEKLDPDNGFLFCPNHDRLFDSGFITFDDTGKVHISEQLSDMDKIFMNVNESMRVNLTDGNKKFLAYHRSNIFIP